MSRSPHRDSFPAGNPLRPYLVYRRSMERPGLHCAPPLPVMPDIRLQIDLLLGQEVLDLQYLVDVILRDLGATLQVMRESAQVCSNACKNRSLIERCVLHLGQAGIRKTVSTTLPSFWHGENAVAWKLWKRARLTAEFVETVAGRFPGIDREMLRLEGLLDEAGRIPAALGWTLAGSDLSNSQVMRQRMWRDWRLPKFLSERVDDAGYDPAARSRAATIVAAAQKLTDAICPLQGATRAQGRPMQFSRLESSGTASLLQQPLKPRLILL